MEDEGCGEARRGAPHQEARGADAHMNHPYWVIYGIVAAALGGTLLGHLMRSCECERGTHVIDAVLIVLWPVVALVLGALALSSF